MSGGCSAEEPVQDLHLKEAHEVVGLLREGRVTPAQLIDVVQARWQATEALVHATPITSFDRARRLAAELQHPDKPPRGYLYGLPVLIKDGQAVAGVRFTEGCLLFAERVAEESEVLVKRLEAKGALVVGKTNVPEFSAGAQSFNSIFPTTVSPWDTRTTAGGSSGGAAAALASCQCWLATGSDLGGSLRTPAAFCGVVGFRPSPGRVPQSKPPPSGPFQALHAVNGPMGRCVRDVALLLDAMEGNEGWDFALPALPGDDSWEKAALRGHARGCGGSPRRVAFSNLGCSVRAEVEELCERAAVTLAGGSPSSVKRLPKDAIDFAAAERVFNVLRGESFAKKFAEVIKNPKFREVLKPEILWNIAVGQVPEAQEMAMSAKADLEELAEQVRRVFEEVDVLCTPVTLDAAFDAEVRYPTAQVGRSFTNYLEWMAPVCIGTMLLCPALVLPCGFLEDGRPVGVQLLGAPGEDAKVLEAAAALESILCVPCSCPEPKRGVVPLETEGPRTAEEAAAHHEGEVPRFVARFRNKVEPSRGAKL